MAQHHSIKENILEEIDLATSLIWTPFSKEEFIRVITKCNNSSTPGPDRLSWSHLKYMLKDNGCLQNIIRIANACLDLDYWPTHFKILTTIVIPKPNKTSYDMPKSFRPIVLLNTLGKLIKKVIGKRLQFSNNFIHQSQLKGLKSNSMTNIGITLTHFICMGWVKNLLTSILAFDIPQFFPSLNYRLLTCILGKVDFNLWVVNFFSNYLVGRRTQYFWNSFMSPLFDVNVGVGQGSTLLPILLALYFFPFLHILEN